MTSAAGKKLSPPPEYGVYHLQVAKGCWCWQVTFRRRGKAYSRRFFETQGRTSGDARAKAIAWRDEQLARLKPLTLREFAQKRRSNNRSGVAGVHFTRPKRQPAGIWQATAKLPSGRRLTRTFSVLTYGEREAYHRAVAARKALVAEIPASAYPHTGLNLRKLRPTPSRSRS